MYFDLENEVDYELSDYILDNDNCEKRSCDAPVSQPANIVSALHILIVVSVILDSAAGDEDSVMESPVLLNARMSFTQHNSVGYIYHQTFHIH